jgi:hypothetical protein
VVVEWGGGGWWLKNKLRVTDETAVLYFFLFEI